MITQKCTDTAIVLISMIEDNKAIRNTVNYLISVFDCHPDIFVVQQVKNDLLCFTNLKHQQIKYIELNYEVYNTKELLLKKALNTIIDICKYSYFMCCNNDVNFSQPSCLLESRRKLIFDEFLYIKENDYIMFSVKYLRKDLKKNEKTNLKLSFYIGSMGRTHHLKQTLQHNLNVAQESGLDVEFNLCNYSSKDELNEWIKCYLSKINYIKIEGKEKWHHSHAKNIAAKLCTGNILCNLDSDIFLSKEFIQFIYEQFKNSDNIIINYKNIENNPEFSDLFGMICITKQYFYTLGGYCETMTEYGGEDSDLIQRSEELLNLVHVSYNPKLLSFIRHSNEERVLNNGGTFNRQFYFGKNYILGKDHIKNKIVNPNGDVWGRR